MGNIVNKYMWRFGRLRIAIKRKYQTVRDKQLGKNDLWFGFRNYRDCDTLVLSLWYLEISFDYK